MNENNFWGAPLPPEERYQMFSWEHIVILLVCLALILIVFFLRNVFRKHPLADKIFRFSLVGVYLTMELVMRYGGINGQLWRMIPQPFCGHMVWIVAIALLSNSKRLMKLIYPLACTGATLSLITIDTCVDRFPSFGAWCYVGIHLLFMIGALYFVFTRKINKFTIKDLGHSLLFAFILASMMSIITCIGKANDLPYWPDEYFLFNPPFGGQDLIDSLGGTFGYTCVWLISIGVIISLIEGITMLCTMKRKAGTEMVEEIKQTEKMDKICSILTQKRINIALIIMLCLVALSVSLQAIVGGVTLIVTGSIIGWLVFILLVINEALYNYRQAIKQQQN